MSHNKEIRENKTNIYLYIYRCLHKTDMQKNKQNKEELLKTITVLVPLTGFMLIAGIITASSTTHSVGLQQVSQLVVVLYLVA